MWLQIATTPQKPFVSHSVGLKKTLISVKQKGFCYALRMTDELWIDVKSYFVPCLIRCHLSTNVILNDGLRQVKPEMPLGLVATSFSTLFSYNCSSTSSFCPEAIQYNWKAVSTTFPDQRILHSFTYLKCWRYHTTESFYRKILFFF